MSCEDGELSRFLGWRAGSILPRTVGVTARGLGCGSLKIARDSRRRALSVLPGPPLGCREVVSPGNAQVPGRQEGPSAQGREACLVGEIPVLLASTKATTSRERPWALLSCSGFGVFLSRGELSGDVYKSGRAHRKGTSLSFSHSDFSTNPSDM